MDRDLFFIVLTTLFLLNSCGRFDPGEIVGTWKATQVVDEGDTVSVDLSATLLTLADDQTFNYQETIIEKMTGSYHLQNSIITLFRDEPHDTIKVQVIDVGPENLILRMNHEGTDRRILFAKN